MEVYINETQVIGIHVKDKVIATWATFQKAMPEKRIFFGLIVLRLATSNGWKNKDSVYAPMTLKEYRDLYGKQYAIDTDGMTMITMPSVTVFFTNKNSETAYFSTYEAAVAHARYIANRNPELIKFGL